MLGAKLVAVNAPGEFRALALAQGHPDRVAGLDPAVVGGNGETKSRVRFPRAETRRVIGCPALDRVGDVPAPRVLPAKFNSDPYLATV